MKIFEKIHRLYAPIKLKTEFRGSWRLKKLLERLAAKEHLINEDGKSIFDMDCDWENLIILDAARHDLYEQVNGPTDYRITKASQTTEFLERTFSQGNYDDIIYITSNPFFEEEKFEEFTGRKPSEVFHSVFRTYRHSWDDQENTVMPESVRKDALTSNKLFPNKKKIIHFMQPHYPFIGFNFTKEGLNQDLDRDRKELSLWQRAAMGQYDRESVWEAYRENLEIVMPHVQDLVEKLEGKTVITSDHGNMVGENGVWGHSRGLRTEQLRKVPWDVRESE